MQEQKPLYKVTSFRVRTDLFELLNRAAYYNQVGQKEILKPHCFSGLMAERMIQYHKKPRPED
jgi:hypothetical protein